MLAKYLKDLRAQRVISASQAVSTLGSGWSAAEDGAIQKEFTFDDFKQASNFMNRYADYCAQVNHTPEWFNVYNRVNVTLRNQEFSAVTTKELNIGQYLETVCKANINQDVEDTLTFEQVSQVAALDVQSRLNDQDEPTSLFTVDEGKQSKS